MANKLTNMARELLTIEADLPYRLDYSTKENPTVDDFQVYVFEQVWASTALGFPGFGGQAITAANTYVLVPMGIHQKCFVYFAGKYAYSVEYSEKFMKDVIGQNIASVTEKGKYITKEDNR